MHWARRARVWDNDFQFACLEHAVNAGAFDAAERMLSKGVRPTEKMLIDAIRDGGFNTYLHS